MTVTAEITSVFEVEFLPLVPKFTQHARRLTKNNHDADDLTQDALLRMLSRLDKYEQGTNALAWGLRVLTNVHSDRMKKRAISHEYVHDFTNIDVMDTASSDQFEQAMSADMKAAISQIPADMATVVLLTDVYKFSVPEVALRLGIPEGTVSSRRQRGRERLRQAYEGLTRCPEGVASLIVV